jgi:hypothetical protein
MSAIATATMSTTDPSSTPLPSAVSSQEVAAETHDWSTGCTG